MTGSVPKTLRVWLIVLGVLALVIGIPATFAYMENKQMEYRYQETMQEVQEVVTGYLVSNYAGVSKVEWQGVGVESLARDVFELSSSLNYVDSEARVYVNETDFFVIEFRLHDVAEYESQSKQFVLKGVLNPENLDKFFEIGLNRTLDKTSDSGKHNFGLFMKSDAGSPNARISYNVDIFKFDWA